MSQLRSMRDDQIQQFWLLRRFFVEAGISRDLSTRIRRFLDYAYQQHQVVIRENDLPVLDMLSEPLKAELQYERYSPWLGLHPFFRTLLSSSYLHSRRSASTHIVHTICNEALVELTLACRDVLFCCGDQAGRMYFCDAGELSYRKAEPFCGRPMEIGSASPRCGRLGGT
eukprot:CAMPEP_0180527978 /NCGR_PEP_ID=MMETSP1036_2-20121128/60534_1 /TAXON_ID=632150 /ORGANISM="Azadinium spinosum, Strain 3D9" /LENGTH=169 /DNA_ID=CAMNT_0022541469 /DNA_START=268 /DNA_END=773 /DNA_ORIENTATION=+